MAQTGTSLCNGLGKYPRGEGSDRARTLTEKRDQTKARGRHAPTNKRRCDGGVQTNVVVHFQLKRIAPQLSPIACWYRILSEAVKTFFNGRQLQPPDAIASLA